MTSKNSNLAVPKIRRGLNFFWEFKATSKESSSKKIVGLVRAPNKLIALTQVKRMGFLRPTVKLELENSIKSGFGWMPPSDFNLREKARLYETIGQRLKRDGSLITALESAQDYLQDGRLRGAVAVLAAQVTDGHPVYQSMVSAGFTMRDAMVVRALAESGQMHSAFTDLGAEARTRHERDSALKSALRMPAIMVGAVLLALPVFFFGLGPKISLFFKRLGSQNTNIPDNIKSIYALVEWVNLNPIISIAIWIAIGIGAVIIWNSSLWTQLSMRIKAFRDLAEKSDHASIWSVYGLMYNAGIPPQDVCDVLRPTARLPKTADALKRMSRRLAAGSDDRDAIESAGFPRFVVSGYRAAKDSGSVAEGLKSFTLMMNEDITMLTQQTKAWLQILSLVISALTVLGVFYIVYYPIAGPILKSL